MSSDTFKIACFGDVVGRPGRDLLREQLPKLRAQHKLNFIVVNAENASGGRGLEPATAREIFDFGVDVITLGDHTWQARDLRNYLAENQAKCIRPANYAAGSPGRGWTTVTTASGVKVGVMNLLGRVFMGLLVDCPFRAADTILAESLADCDVVICDIHAEATSEKIAMARYLDGRASLVFGTHSHVQTSDERILSGGTAALTDVGMCGSTNGVLGMDTEVALERFLTGRPSSYRVAEGSPELNGLVCTVNLKSKKAVHIERLRIA